METQFKKWGEKDVEVVGSVGSFGWTTDSWLCFFTVTLSKNPTTAERVRGRRDAQVAADSCTSAADIVHLRLFITVGKQGSVTGIIYVPPVHAGLGKSALWCLFFCFLKSLAVRWLLTLPPYKITHHTDFIKEGKSRKKTKTSLYPALLYLLLFIWHFCIGSIFQAQRVSLDTNWYWNWGYWHFGAAASVLWPETETMLLRKLWLLSKVTFYTCLCHSQVIELHAQLQSAEEKSRTEREELRDQLHHLSAENASTKLHNQSLKVCSGELAARYGFGWYEIKTVKEKPTANVVSKLLWSKGNVFMCSLW